MTTLPKRNKSKDNPYTIGFDENQKSYYVRFNDKKNTYNVEITYEVYLAFNEFELEDISQIHKDRKHIEQSEIYEETLFRRSINKQVSVEQQVENEIINEFLMKCINELPEIQKRRALKYYFESMTLEQIAKEEKCSKRAIKFSIDIALDKIFKKFKF